MAIQYVDLTPSGKSRRQVAQEALNRGLQAGSQVFEGIQKTRRQEALDAERQANQKFQRDAMFASKGIDPTQFSQEQLPAQQGEMSDLPATTFRTSPQDAQASAFSQLAKQAQGQQAGAATDKRLGRQLTRAKIEQLKSMPGKKQNEIARKEKLFNRTVRRDLIKDRQKLDKEFQPFDRLFGTIGNLEKNFKTGSMSGTDKFQLVRAFVPLSEINPGVVRDSEFESVNAQGSTLNKLQQLAEREFKENGTIPDELVQQIFDTSASIKEAIFRGKKSRLGNIDEEIGLEGLDEKTRGVILGSNNVSFMGEKSPEEKREIANTQAAQQNQSFFSNVFNQAQASPGTPLLMQANPEKGELLQRLRAKKAGTLPEGGR